MKTFSITLIILLALTYSSKINFDKLRKWNEVGLDALKDFNNKIINSIENGKILNSLLEIGKSALNGVESPTSELKSVLGLMNSKENDHFHI